MLATAAAALAGRLADARSHQPLLLKAVERRVDGADGKPAVRAKLDIAADRRPVGDGTEADQREENELLELAERYHAGDQIFHIVEHMSIRLTCPSSSPSIRQCTATCERLACRRCSCTVNGNFLEGRERPGRERRRGDSDS